MLKIKDLNSYLYSSNSMLSAVRVFLLLLPPLEDLDPIYEVVSHTILDAPILIALVPTALGIRGMQGRALRADRVIVTNSGDIVS